jgi:hypothetical protein
MEQIAGTLPEPKLQSTKKKKAPQVAAAMPTAHEREVKVNKEKAKTKPKKPGDYIIKGWPILVAIFLTGFAPEWHAMAVSSGIWALRFTFPYALLATHREIGIDAQMASILPNAAIYLQIPIDGVYMAIHLARGKSLTSGIVQILMIHGVCTLVLWLLNYL